MDRTVILTSVRYYLPGYKAGGPLRTISNMVEALSDQFHFRIITSDRDGLESAPYAGIQLNTWNPVGKASVYYMSSPQMSQFRRLLNDTPHDVLYVNSFFDRDFTIRPLVLRRLGQVPPIPCVIAPRGEFSEGAMRIRGWKKALFVKAARVLGIYDDLCWQASSKLECDDIRRVMGRTAENIRIAMDLPSQARTPSGDGGRAGSKSEKDPLRVCFLSRVSPKKNLMFVLRVLMRVTVPVELTIYGLIDDEPYWRKCKELIARLPPHIAARYQGSVEYAKVSSILSGADLFFLPTFGENYGHAIIEALSAGTPVLISDKTPWRNLAEKGVGWDLPLEEEVFLECFERFAATSANDRSLMRRNSYQFARGILEDEKNVQDNRNLFEFASSAKRQ